MKKILLFVLLTLLVLFSAGATVSAPATGSSGSASYEGEAESSFDGLAAYMKATFDMSAETNQKVVIGFTKENGPQSVKDNIKKVEEVSLTANPETATAKYDGTDLKVFYQIQYKNPLNLKLSLSDDLVLDDEGVSNPTDIQKLGWKVAITGDENIAKSPSYDGGSSAVTLEVHDAALFTTVGSKVLEIETSEYSSKEPGSYVGYIIAEINTP